MHTSTHNKQINRIQCECFHIVRLVIKVFFHLLFFFFCHNTYCTYVFMFVCLETQLQQYLRFFYDFFFFCTYVPMLTYYTLLPLFYVLFIFHLFCFFFFVQVFTLGLCLLNYSSIGKACVQIRRFWFSSILQRGKQSRKKDVTALPLF